MTSDRTDLFFLQSDGSDGHREINISAESLVSTFRDPRSDVIPDTEAHSVAMPHHDELIVTAIDVQKLRPDESHSHEIRDLSHCKGSDLAHISTHLGSCTTTGNGDRSSMLVTE